MVSDYYLPQHGVFDLLVKLKTGGFRTRASPRTARYRYRPDGGFREHHIDRYPANRQG